MFVVTLLLPCVTLKTLEPSHNMFCFDSVRMIDAGWSVITVLIQHHANYVPKVKQVLTSLHIVDVTVASVCLVTVMLTHRSEYKVPSAVDVKI